MKLIEVIADSSHTDTLVRLAKQYGAEDCWLGPVNEDKRQPLRMLVGPDNRQEVLDALQARLATSESSRIIIYPIEATLPYPDKQQEQKSESAQHDICPPGASGKGADVSVGKNREKRADRL